MMPRLRFPTLLLLTVVLLMTVGCDLLSPSGKEEPTPTPIPPPPIPEKPIYTVKRGVVVDSLSFTGRVAPVIEEELFFRETGRVKRVYVEREDLVTEGTLLADLENDDLVRQLAQTELELETAELNLTRALGSRQFSIDNAKIDLQIQELRLGKAEDSLTSLEADVAIAKASQNEAIAGVSPLDLEIARRQVERAKNSLWGAQVNRDSTCGRTKGADCDSAQASVQRAEHDVRIQEINYEKLQQGPTEEDLIILQANSDKATQRLKQTEIDIEIQRLEIALSKLDLENLQKEVDPQLTKAVERSKLGVERLKAQVENTRIVSPIDGKLTSVSAYEGREVNAYKPVFIVADEAEVEVTAEPMSSQLQRLTENMAAAIILSAYPGKELPGEILQLPYPYGSGGGASLEEADKLTHISFDPQDLDIEPGDLVKVLVTLERKEDALWLPPAAIRTFAGRKFVEIDEEGRRRRVDITIGIESSERVEVEAGLEEGQIVIGQ